MKIYREKMDLNRERRVGGDGAWSWKREMGTYYGFRYSRRLVLHVGG